MNWASKQHPVETAVEWLAPAMFAGALAWSAVSLGLAPVAVATASAAAFVAGLLAVRVLGKPAEAPAAAFEPVDFELCADELDELLLDTPLIEAAGADELLLDDPLTDVAEGARVVRLFARQEPTPGELVARIEDFLGEDARRMRPAAAQPIPDAGAALHAALANVRASLK